MIGTKADNTDSTGLGRREAKGYRAGKGHKNTDLSRRAEDKALGVGDQGTEVGHTADAQEDERRIDSELYTLIEIV